MPFVDGTVTSASSFGEYLLIVTFDHLLFPDRNGQHRQQMGRNHHHRRYTNLPKTVVERDDAMRPVAEMASSTTKTTGPYSPFLMVDDDSTKTMIPVQASLNGNIFMHCPVDINEDFQVSPTRIFHIYRLLRADKTSRSLMTSLERSSEMKL